MAGATGASRESKLNAQYDAVPRCRRLRLERVLFHADFLRPLGLNLKDGIEDSLGGVGRQTFIPVYYHDISILVGIDWTIGVRAGFSEELSIAGLLGRLGFFDAFRVTFDHSVHPPAFEIDRIEHRAIH